MKKNSLGYYVFLIFIFSLSGQILFTSCKKDDDIEVEEEEEQIVNENNEAFSGLMKEWYYWYDQLPDVDPNDFDSPYELMEEFRYLPLDRWSYVTTRQEFEAYYRDSKMIGYGFGSMWDQTGRLRITFIFNSTDLYEQGVRRSWIIEEINGTRIRVGVSINQLLGANEIGVSNDFVFIDPEGNEVGMTVSKQEVIMNTVLHKEVFETGNSKTGYLVFKNFTTPSFDELEEALEFFNSEGIDELILDLRYNGGGATSVANYLASLIGGQRVAGEPFAKYLYNDNKEDENFTDTFDPPQASLDINRLITIATRGTASASEMVINGLRPFMDVYIIGGDTYGKPMGMNAWYYNSYAFVPVTFKIANADDFGDYFDGLEADAFAADDITRLFGDPEEASLKEALNFIETGTFSGQLKTKSLVVQPWEQMTGLRREIGAH